MRYWSYCDPIGKILQICVLLSIAKFKSKKSDILAVCIVYLSTEQKNMLEKLQTISTSVCSTAISCRSPGTITQAMLIIILYRIFTLYVTTDKLTSECFILYEDIIKANFSGYSKIKVNLLYFNNAQNVQTIHQKFHFLLFQVMPTSQINDVSTNATR